jgi:S1-C subfamily serine protease
MLRALVLAAALAIVPQASQTVGVLHIKISLVDAAQTVTPVPRHALLISDNPASAPPRRIVTAVDGTADVRLRPGNYTVESDKPVTFHGKAYEWRQTVDIVAGRDAVLELTAGNADIADAPASAVTSDTGRDPGASRPLEADPAFLLPKWQDSVVAVWTATNRASGFVVDASGLVATTERLIGSETSVEVQLSPTVKVAGRVVVADPAQEVAILRVEAKAVAALKPVPLGCDTLATVARGDEVFAIGAPMRQPRNMSSGVVNGLETHTVLADVELQSGSAGGPVFTAAGDLVGLTSIVDESRDGAARASRGGIRIVRASEACAAVTAAREKLSKAAAPAAVPALPVEPATPFPVDTLREAAKRGVGSLGPYQVSASTFDVTFITPLLTYGAMFESRQNRRTTSQDTRRPDPEPALVMPLVQFSNWSDYVAEFPPVVLVRVTPKMVEGFWTKVARGAASTQGMSIPPIKRIRSGFGRLRAFCGDAEVTPVHPFKIEQLFPGQDDVVYEGLYAFAPDALTPQCGTVKLMIYSEKEPEKADTRIVPVELLQRVWQDFEAYRAAAR